MIRNRFVLFLFALSAGPAFTLPLPTPQNLQNLVLQDYSMAMTDTYDFEGIVALSNCSGSLVRFEDSSENQRAMVLTNGHCLENGFLEPGKIAKDQPASRFFTLLSKNANPLGRVQAQKLIYATMTKTDMALYLLKETYSEILSAHNIKPLTLSNTPADPKTEIEILSGYWKRGYSCRHDGLVHQLHEGGWVWEDSIRYSQPGCETIPGTSGSPIIARGTKVVIGVNNTGNESGQKCTENNPCEVDAEGKVTYKKGLNYGQQTSWVYNCLGSDHQLDLSLPNCELPQ